MAITCNVLGYLGGDAKETPKGFYFNVSSKGLDFKTGETGITWVCCFVNYKNPTLMDRLKKGTFISVWGDCHLTLSKNSDETQYPSMTLTVDRVIPLSPKKE